MTKHDIKHHQLPTDDKDSREDLSDTDEESLGSQSQHDEQQAQHHAGGLGELSDKQKEDLAKRASEVKQTRTLEDAKKAIREKEGMHKMATGVESHKSRFSLWGKKKDADGKNENLVYGRGQEHKTGGPK